MEGLVLAVAVAGEAQACRGRQHTGRRHRRVAELPLQPTGGWIDGAQRAAVLLIARPDRPAALVLFARLELLVPGAIHRARFPCGDEKQARRRIVEERHEAAAAADIATPP